MATSKGMEVLDQPLHGIIIPSALLFVGCVVIAWAADEIKYFTAGIGMLVIILAFRFYEAYSRETSISSEHWTALELEEQTLISRNTAIYRFKLKNRAETLNIPVGFHLAVKVNLDGSEQIRYYTPITNKFATGYFDILVKSYPDGKVSKWFAGLTTGQTVEFKGPVGRLNYTSTIHKNIGMIAGGSGITPMLSVLNEIITTPEDSTRVSLIYANETANDILLKDELDEIAEKYPYFEVHYVLNKPDINWSGYIGYVTKEHMAKHLPGPEPENRLFICGPPEMKKMLLGYAEELGWPKGIMSSKPDDQVFVF